MPPSLFICVFACDVWVHAHMDIIVCAQVCIHVYVCSPEVGVRCLPWPLSTFYAEVGSLAWYPCPAPTPATRALLVLCISLTDFPLPIVWSLCSWSPTKSTSNLPQRVCLISLCSENAQTSNSLNGFSQYVSQLLQRNFLSVAACLWNLWCAI